VRGQMLGWEGGEKRKKRSGEDEKRIRKKRI
jgi:hypothetical protein